MESLTTSITSIAGALSSLITYRPIGSTSTGKADADQWIISQTHEAQVQAQASQANPTQIFRQLLGYRHLTERLTHARGLPGRPGQRLLWSRSRAGGTQPSAASPSRAHAAPNGKRRCRRIPAQPSRSRACARYDRFFFPRKKHCSAGQDPHIVSCARGRGRPIRTLLTATTSASPLPRSTPVVRTRCGDRPVSGRCPAARRWTGPGGRTDMRGGHGWR
jgi:hypothetical protein